MLISKHLNVNYILLILLVAILKSEILSEIRENARNYIIFPCACFIFKMYLNIYKEQSCTFFKNADSGLCSYFELGRTAYINTQQFNIFNIKLHFITCGIDNLDS